MDEFHLHCTCAGDNDVHNESGNTGGFICGFTCSWNISAGSTFIKKNIMITIPVVIFSVVIQPVFNYSGITPVFYINDNMVCLENIIYGAVISVLLISVIQWCSVAASYLSSEK